MYGLQDYPIHVGGSDGVGAFERDADGTRTLTQLAYKYGRAPHELRAALVADQEHYVIISK